MGADLKAVAVVPTYNEEELIGETVDALVAMEGVERVVVIDDCSADSSGRIAREHGATLVVNGTNLGKGGSLNRVLGTLEFEALVLIDGDLGDYAREAAKLLEPVLSGEADLAIAAFPPPAKKGGFGLVKGLAHKGIERMTGLNMRSPISGQRAMTRAAFDAVWPFRKGFGVEVAMTIDASRAGMRVVEVPTDMGHRETGRDLAGFIHRGRQFADILGALASRMFTKRG
jgi:glycosyltransferase involved in cell wall biosynthesis